MSSLFSGPASQTIQDDVSNVYLRCFSSHSLCADVLFTYAALDHETKPRNISAWTPTVVTIMKGLANLQDEDVCIPSLRFIFMAINHCAVSNILNLMTCAVQALSSQILPRLHQPSDPRESSIRNSQWIARIARARWCLLWALTYRIRKA